MRVSLNKLLFLILLITLLVAANINAVSAQQQNIEIVASFDAETPPGNIAIGTDGRIFMSVHEFYGKPVRVVEVMPDGRTKPYPNKQWAYSTQGTKNVGLYGVLGLNVDQNGILWMLDVSGENHSGRLVGWNTKSESLHRVFYLAKPVISDNSFLNDLAIDLKHNTAFITDTGTGSIVIVDLTTGIVRSVLASAKQTKAEDIDMIIDGEVVHLGGAPVRLGINPITIDSKNQYLYFGSMNGTSVYRIKTTDLLNKNLSEQALVSRIERYGDKPISDGITIDDAGNVYVTSITDDSIGVTDKDGNYRTLVTRDDLSWPDGLAVGPNNYIYATINELHRSPPLNNTTVQPKGEFKIVRLKALSKATTGR